MCYLFEKMNFKNVNRFYKCDSSNYQLYSFYVNYESIGFKTLELKARKVELIMVEKQF